VFGGGFGQFGGAHIVASKPTSARSWSVTARETVATQKEWILRTYVVCANVQ
jgi:hypothetical protein